MSLRLGVQKLETFFSRKRANIPKGILHIKYYANMFNLRSLFHSVEPKKEADIRNEILWQNKFITHKNSPLDWRNWVEAGIISINDICHPIEGRFYSHSEIREK